MKNEINIIFFGSYHCIDKHMNLEKANSSSTFFSRAARILTPTIEHKRE
jgi:hypothetical protein